jgi:CheY-like chemotaxis protein
MAARILVADDSVTIQKVVELTFSKEDFVLIPARSGEEAIRKAKEVQPDLILLDLVMPDKSGYEVCSALRAEPMLRAVPIIMLTGTYEAFDKDQGLRAGANDFVTKPFESQVLITKVKQLLFARTVETKAPASPVPVTAPPKVALTPPPTEAPPPAPKAPPPAPPRAVAPPAVSGVPPAAGPARPVTPSPSLPAEPPTLELPTLELEPIPGGSKPAGAEASPFPEGLSLEELLEPTAVVSAEPPLAKSPPGSVETSPEAALAPTPIEGLLAEGEQVFDLTADMQGPSLPLVEVGTGEPPALSVEDLVGRGEAAPTRAAATVPPEAAPEVAPLDGLMAEGEQVFDLTADTQGPSLPLVEVGTGEPPALSVEDLLRPAGAAPVEAGVGAVPEIQLEPLIESPSVPPEMPAPSAGPPDISELVEAAAAAAPSVPAAPLMEEVLATPPSPPPSAAVTQELGTLRQAVTERVAHELAKELSGQLIERIERIVWEVVPDLAEILINKEIERIRAMAEGKQPS